MEYSKMNITFVRIDQIANIRWIIEKARVPEKHLFLLYWLCQAFDCMDHNKLWKILKEMGTPDHLICLLRNLYAGQEATVRTGHGTTDWFQIRKGVRQGCILSPCLFNPSYNGEALGGILEPRETNIFPIRSDGLIHLRWWHQWVPSRWSIPCPTPAFTRWAENIHKG